MSMSSRSRCWLAFGPIVLATQTAGQFGGFQIPMEMMFGGGGGGQVKQTEWPKTENSEIAPEFEWLINTEWKGKTAKYLLLRDGIVESDLKECEQEGQCLWAANAGRLLINTPSLKIVRFNILGLETADLKKLASKDEAALAAISFIAEKAAKNGKKSQLGFSGVPKAMEDDNIIARDLFEILEVTEDADQAAVKSKYRRLSVINHPDKGGTPEAFNDLREAYEILSDNDKRKYYVLGGQQLVKNVELGWKEVDGQLAKLDQQLTQVPKNHPQYQAFKQQVDAQKAQFDKVSSRHNIEKNLRSGDLEVMVPVSAQELYNGAPEKPFEFKRLMICRGCRANPERPQCAECGRCSPEKVQVPKYANTPFGRQVVAMKEKEQESRERCREVGVQLQFRVPKGAKDGVALKSVADIGHQTPGKVPGRVVFKVQRGSPNDIYRIAESDLYTVLRVSLEQALFGFSVSWRHLGDETVTVTMGALEKPNEVVVLKKKGLVSEGGGRGDLYVRIAVDLPSPQSPPSTELTLRRPSNAASQARLEIEEPVRVDEGSAWRHWTSREAAKEVKASKGHQEL